MIFSGLPRDWNDLEAKVCQIFTEAGCVASRGRTMKTVRGPVDVDVVVQDTTQRPHALILCECKNWNRKVPKTVVHAFRTVVHDTGASLGFIISERGFQPGARAAAAKSNTRLLTWKQFQREMYDRWFDALETRLILLADELFELADAGVEEGSHPTLMREALDSGAEQVWNEAEQLNQRYVQFLFASSHVAAGALRRFPFEGVDPRASTQTSIVFRSARMYFDIMFESAPKAFSDYTEFLLKHTGGRCGSHQLLDDTIIGQMIEGKTTMSDVNRLLGNKGWIHVVPDGEVWTFQGSVTQFQMSHDSKTGRQWGRPLTSSRTLLLDFGPNAVARRVTIEDSEYSGPPRP
jgi:hypothetical protein